MVAPVVGLIAVWANLHAEAVFGAAWLLLMGVASGRSGMTRGAARIALAAGAAGLVATLVTPYGSGLWRYLVENALVPQALSTRPETSTGAATASMRRVREGWAGRDVTGGNATGAPPW